MCVHLVKSCGCGNWISSGCFSFLLLVLRPCSSSRCAKHCRGRVHSSPPFHICRLNVRRGAFTYNSMAAYVKLLCVSNCSACPCLMHFGEYAAGNQQSKRESSYLKFNQRTTWDYCRSSFLLSWYRSWDRGWTEVGWKSGHRGCSNIRMFIAISQIWRMCTVNKKFRFGKLHGTKQVRFVELHCKQQLHVMWLDCSELNTLQKCKLQWPIKVIGPEKFGSKQAKPKTSLAPSCF